MLRFQIPTMTCGGCVKAVTRAVAALDGQAKVEADLGTKEVAVDTVVPVETVAAALTKAGYTPRLLAPAAALE